MSQTNLYSPIPRDLVPAATGVKIIYADESFRRDQIANDTLLTTAISWKANADDLIDRLDYLTSVFPFNLIEISEVTPGSGPNGEWCLRLHYWGARANKTHLTNNFLKLIEPRQSKPKKT